MAVATPVDPVEIARTVVTDTGGQTLDFAVGIAPIAVPIVLGLTAVTWGLAKFGLMGKRRAKA